MRKIVSVASRKEDYKNNFWRKIETQLELWRSVLINGETTIELTLKMCLRSVANST